MMRLIQFVVFGAEIMMSLVNRNAPCARLAARLNWPEFGSPRIRSAIQNVSAVLIGICNSAQNLEGVENPMEARERIVG